MNIMYENLQKEMRRTLKMKNMHSHDELFTENKGKFLIGLYISNKSYTIWPLKK